MSHNTKQANNSCASSVYQNLVGGQNTHENLSNCDSPQYLSNHDSLMSRQNNNQNATVISSAEALVKLLNRTLYPIVQENGQRRYGPPPDWKGEPPARGCEVFIGKIPRDCFEDELVPVFEKAGKIYMFRLMMDFTGTNRGYGFCVYWTRDDTRRAVSLLNNYEIRTDKALGVCLSVDNCRLFVGGIPKSKTKEEIFVEMRRVTEGVRDVIAYPSVADKTKNRGFAFVEYDSHKAAAMARRKLIPGRIQLWGQQIAVDWAEPEREVTEEIMSSVKILYVRNLMLSTTEETLRSAFVSASGGSSDCVERVKKLKDYAFIHFKDRSYAEVAMRLINNTQIDSSWVEVSWAKPADKTDQKPKQSINSPNSPITVIQNGTEHTSLQLDNNQSLHDLFTGSNQIFIDSTNGISYIGAPIHNITQQPQTILSLGSCSPSKSRPSRRNAAGSRSISNREKRNIEVNEGQEVQTPNWSTTTPIITSKPEWDGYNVKYQCIPTQMLFPGVNFVSSSLSNASSLINQNSSDDRVTNEIVHNSEVSSNNIQLASSVASSQLGPSMMTTSYGIPNSDPQHQQQQQQPIYYNFMTTCPPPIQYLQPSHNPHHTTQMPTQPTPYSTQNTVAAPTHAYYTHHSIPYPAVMHPHTATTQQHAPPQHQASHLTQTQHLTQAQPQSAHSNTNNPAQLQSYPIIMPLTIDYNTLDNSAYLYSTHQTNPSTTLLPTFSLPPNP